jgi:hypothetical protein
MRHSKLKKRPLAIWEILRWADAYRETTGQWPTSHDGAIVGTIGETWTNVDMALRLGLRGLPGGSSLSQLLAQHRGTRPRRQLPPLTEEQILAWADAHHQRTGAWPTVKLRLIPNSGGEKWQTIDNCLRDGDRGLPGGSSLARLLAEHRGVRNRQNLPPLTEEQILAWADAYHQSTGGWPVARHGDPIPGAPAENWMGVDEALRSGRRGLPGGSSLALLLAERRGVRNLWSRPDLSEAQILVWADAHHARTGKWPTQHSGPVLDAPGESWIAVDSALKRGRRGLPGGSSLGQLLGRERGKRTRSLLPRLSRKQILAWATAHHQRTGQWPTEDSGPIPEAPAETWRGVTTALYKGLRGLRGGSSLAQLLAEYGKQRNRMRLPPFSRKKIVAWADAHHERTGQWPTRSTGPVADAPGENWQRIDAALRKGGRGLPGGESLARLLARKRGVRHPRALPPLTVEQILAWADGHFRRTGTWPRKGSGAIGEAPGETWRGVDHALQSGKRGLAAGSSLSRLLRAHRGV